MDVERRKDKKRIEDIINKELEGKKEGQKEIVKT